MFGPGTNQRQAYVLSFRCSTLDTPNRHGYIQSRTYVDFRSGWFSTMQNNPYSPRMMHRRYDYSRCCGRASLPSITSNLRFCFFKPWPCAYIMCLHTLPHLARPTLNDFQPHHHEMVSFVFVRARSPPGLALVPCALSAVVKRGRKNG